MILSNKKKLQQQNFCEFPKNQWCDLLYKKGRRVLKVEKVISQLIPNLAEQVQMGSILIGIYIFFLSAFLGYHLITRVPPLLHTPLMSLTNAISAISIVGAMVIAGMKHDLITTILGTIAVLAASINVVGGYIITERTLRMFRGRGGGKK